MKVGVLGTGQLALMMAQANKGLGIEVVPFGQKGSDELETICSPVYGQLNDEQALDQFLESVDVATFDSENMPVEQLAKSRFADKFFPSLESIRIFQNRLLEKSFFVNEGLKTTRFMSLTEEADLKTAAETIGFPAVMKTVTEGYDGRGQVIAKNAEQLEQGWIELQKNCLVEEFIPFDRELSIIAARGRNGDIAYYPLTENSHRNGQLRLSIVNETSPLQATAEAMISKVMNKLDYVGCMAIEFFVKGDQLIINEVAPRVHNSGHWTMDGADRSQFFQHLVAVSGQAMKTPSITMPVAMINCIGELPDFSQYSGDEAISCYDYGKEPRPERKLGHINVLGNGRTDVEFYTQVSSILEEADEPALVAHLAELISKAS